MKKAYCFVAIVFAMVLILNGVSYAVETLSPNVQVTFLNQDPSPASAGDTVYVRFKVENTGGGTANNVQLEMLNAYPFTVIDKPALQELGALYGYQTNKNYVNIEYKLKIDKDAVNGGHELKLRYRYEGYDWIIGSFAIDVASRQFAQIIVDKAKLQPGAETDLKFIVANTGNSPLQNLVFSWSEPNGAVLPVYSDNTKYIKYLDIGKSVDLDYKVIADVNAKPGLYRLNLDLKYESVQNSTSTSISTSAGVFIGGETDFDIAFSQSSQGQTSLSVSNTGNNPAQSVSVRIPQQPNFRVSGTDSAIIGNLDKGDYTVVSFQITPSSGNFSGSRQRALSQGTPSFQNEQAGFAGRGNNLRVLIDYTDTTGERRSVEKNVSIQFRDLSAAGSAQIGRTTQTSFFSSWTFYIIVIAAIAVGFYYRKKLAEFIQSIPKQKKK